MRHIVTLTMMFGFVLTAGCQASATEIDTPVDTTSTSPAPPLPSSGDTQMPSSIPTPAEAGLQSLIEKAKIDLARRLSVPANGISVLQAESVTWPDSSLGCPQEGMLYAQVLTPGYLIRLSSGGQEFEYHASRGTEVVYCENPMPPVEGTPDNV